MTNQQIENQLKQEVDFYQGKNDLWYWATEECHCDSFGFDTEDEAINDFEMFLEGEEYKF